MKFVNMLVLQMTIDKELPSSYIEEYRVHQYNLNPSCAYAIHSWLGNPWHAWLLLKELPWFTRMQVFWTQKFSSMLSVPKSVHSDHFVDGKDVEEVTRLLLVMCS